MVGIAGTSGMAGISGITGTAGVNGIVGTAGTDGDGVGFATGSDRTAGAGAATDSEGDARDEGRDGVFGSEA